LGSCCPLAAFCNKQKRRGFKPRLFFDGGGARIRTLEGESQQIYSLLKVAFLLEFVLGGGK